MHRREKRPFREVNPPQPRDFCEWTNIDIVVHHGVDRDAVQRANVGQGPGVRQLVAIEDNGRETVEGINPQKLDGQGWNG